MIDFFIYGGCATRDTFSRAEIEKNVRIKKYFCRTIPASFATEKFIFENDLNVDIFEERVVFDDVQKTFFRDLSESHFDYLIVDFATAAYADLFKYKNFYGTLSSYANSFMDENKIKYEVIPCWSDVYKRNHDVGLRFFCDFFNEKGWANKVILNKIYPAQVGDLFLADLIKFRLDDIYNYLDRFLPNCLVLNYSNDLFEADLNHKWGAFYFHYTEKFYQNQESQLLGLIR